MILDDNTANPWEKAFKAEHGRFPNDLDRLAKSDADTRNLIRELIQRINMLCEQLARIEDKLDR